MRLSVDFWVGMKGFIFERCEDWKEMRLSGNVHDMKEPVKG